MLRELVGMFKSVIESTAYEASYTVRIKMTTDLVGDGVCTIGMGIGDIYAQPVARLSLCKCVCSSTKKRWQVISKLLFIMFNLLMYNKFLI